MARAPYMGDDAIAWCIDKAIAIIGFDFYHGAYPAGDKKVAERSGRNFALNGIITMPYLRNLGAISKDRVTLIALPLKMIAVEASPIRAIVLED
jgi:kynurenine formamidase